MFNFWQTPKKLLFYRDYAGLTGGHLKVWDYYTHTRHAKHYQPAIYFSPHSVWDSHNPWRAEREQVLATWQPEQADALFLAGLDWQMLPAAQRDAYSKPIINLIQGLRHAQPTDSRYAFLSHRAIRITVSQAITDALHATGKVNGPIFTHPNGISTQDFPPPLPQAARPQQVLIIGLKQPELAQQLYQRLQALSLKVRVLTDKVSRQDFLTALNQAQITVFLPYAEEGFYLPALEGMALQTVVICPDCGGNRDFCLPAHNCLLPAYELEALVAAVQEALNMTPLQRDSLLEHAQATLDKHTLLTERRYFLKILQAVKQLW